jgi:chromosome partitioning protein
MDKIYWSSSDIHKLYRLDQRVKSRQTLLNAEERGEIPKAQRIARGSTMVRQWTLDQLPEIGSKYGFLHKPSKQKVICIYTAKGGILKTTLSYNIARMLALNGIKTLIIGLDIQCSITDITLPQKPVESLEQSISRPLSLYHFLYEKIPLKSIIQDTTLPTLKIIPEAPDLNMLEKKLRLEPRREYLLDGLVKQLPEFDVIIFDNSPSWNQLIENALTAASVVISPIGCDIGTYQALQTNLDALEGFRNAMINLSWESPLLIPTLLEKSKLSQQIYGAYLNNYGDSLIPNPIRRGVKGQEAILLGKSVIEHDPSSPLAQDYYELMQALWERISPQGQTDGIK